MTAAQKGLVLSKGFTLLELLVVIAIIGILAGFIVSNITSPLAKARDVQRKSDLKQLQRALQDYYNVYGAYPSTSGAWWGETTTYGNHITDYIPNTNSFVPNYIKRLPNDPRVGKPGPGGIAVNCNSGNSGYLYRSDGINYKLISACTPEGKLGNVNDALYDPVRPTYAWQISTEDVYSSW